MDTKFTEQESLALISEMIDRAKRNIRQNNGRFMIFWGYMVASAALINILLVFILWNLSISINYSYNIWWIMLPAWVISFRLERKTDRSAIVKSHIDNIISSIWRAFGISNVVFLLMIFSLAYGLREFAHFFYLINPIIILTTGIGEFITAKVCRFRPFMHGAIAMWTGALIGTFAVILSPGNGVLVQFLILAVCMLVGFVIPGYKLNRLAKENHV
jgi:hypothetical protein